MLFDKNDNGANERIICQTKPSMILGCKKAVFGFILLAIILSVSPIIIRYIGEMQVYLISYVKLSLTRYAAIAIFVVIVVDMIYIIWQLVGWYSMDYILTDNRIIVKSGVISTKKNYMPYAAIQDINTSQSIFAKILNVGTISVFSAYDSNQMELSNVPNSSEIEEIIFSNMMGYRNFPRENKQIFNSQNQVQQIRDDYYDDFEPITPVGHERNYAPRRDYEYYPEDRVYDAKPRREYEYEHYGNKISPEENDITFESRDNSIRFEGAGNSYTDERYYNEVRSDYSYDEEDYSNNIEPQSNFDKWAQENSLNDSDNTDDSGEKAIKRHFDKFKK